MLNAVGLQGPGVPHWRDEVLPGLLRTGATVVATSIDEVRGLVLGMPRPGGPVGA